MALTAVGRIIRGYLLSTVGTDAPRVAGPRALPVLKVQEPGERIHRAEPAAAARGLDCEAVLNSLAVRIGASYPRGVKLTRPAGWGILDLVARLAITVGMILAWIANDDGVAFALAVVIAVWANGALAWTLIRRSRTS